MVDDLFSVESLMADPLDAATITNSIFYCVCGGVNTLMGRPDGTVFCYQCGKTIVGLEVLRPESIN